MMLFREGEANPKSYERGWSIPFRGLWALDKKSEARNPKSETNPNIK
jgi:hypothetical protein